MRVPEELFENNKKWAAQMLRKDPQFFSRLAIQQSPQILWIGCSDSRVPANEIAGLMPGEVFVHRNVGNVVSHSDTNCLSAIQYAVDVLGVADIVVVGHYGCGGVRAVLERAGVGIVDQWLSPIREIRRRYDDFFSALPDDQARWDKLCELNVIEQTSVVFRTPIIQAAWANGRKIAIHGWIYSIHDGLLRDLHVTVTHPEEAEQRRKAALQAVLSSPKFADED